MSGNSNAPRLARKASAASGRTRRHSIGKAMCHRAWLRVAPSASANSQWRSIRATVHRRSSDSVMTGADTAARAAISPIAHSSCTSVGKSWGTRISPTRRASRATKPPGLDHCNTSKPTTAGGVASSVPSEACARRLAASHGQAKAIPSDSPTDSVVAAAATPALYMAVRRRPGSAKAACHAVPSVAADRNRPTAPTL